MAFSASNFSNVVAFNYTDSFGKGYASGVVVGKHAILTVAHAIDAAGDHLSPIKIGFGTTAFADNVFSTATGGQTQILMKGRDLTNYAPLDYAIVATSADLSGLLPMQLGTPSVGQTVHVTGYPVTISRGTQQDVIATISSINAKGEIAYQNSDITVGNSGGPLWGLNAAGQTTVFGIQSQESLSDNTKYAAAMTTDTITTIQKWITQANSLFANGSVSVSANLDAPGLAPRATIADNFTTSLTGSDQRDRFLTTTKAITIDGGRGFDTVVFNGGTRNDYVVSSATQTSSGVAVTVRNSTGAVSTLTNIERLEFDDGVIDFSSSLHYAIADQLTVVYFGRGISEQSRNKIAAALDNGISQQVAQGLYNGAIKDRVFLSTDSTETVVNKTFLNIFGVNASSFEQTAWANTVNVGAVTKEALPWAMFVSYLGATNVPPSYQIPAQSRIIATNAFTEKLNGASATALDLGSAGAQAARDWLLPIRSQQDAALKQQDAAASVARISGHAAAEVADAGAFIANVNYGLAGVLPLTL